jgi:hypothetical protein
LRERNKALIIARQTASAATSQKKGDYAILIVDMHSKNCAAIEQTPVQNSSVQPKRDQSIKIDKRKKNMAITIQQGRSRRR